MSESFSSSEKKWWSGCSCSPAVSRYSEYTINQLMDMATTSDPCTMVFIGPDDIILLIVATTPTEHLNRTIASVTATNMLSFSNRSWQTKIRWKRSSRLESRHVWVHLSNWSRTVMQQRHRPSQSDRSEKITKYGRCDREGWHSDVVDSQRTTAKDAYSFASTGRAVPKCELGLFY